MGSHLEQAVPLSLVMKPFWRIKAAPEQLGIGSPDESSGTHQALQPGGLQLPLPAQPCTTTKQSQEGWDANCG